MLRLVFFSLSIYLALSLVLGPITAAIVSAIGLVTWRRKLEGNPEIEEKQLRRISNFGFMCFFVVLTYWSGYLSRPLLARAAIAVVGAALTYWGQLRKLELTADFRMPEPTYPVAISYLQPEISSMLGLRTSLLEKERFREKMQKVSIGSYYMETICSVLLYHDVYNDVRVRYFAYLFFNYLLPVVFLVQSLVLVSPWLNRFASAIRSDVGVQVVSSVEIVMPEVVSNMVAWISTPFAVAATWFSASIQFLIPFDEAFVYLRNRMSFLSTLVSPFIYIFQGVSEVVLQAAGDSYSLLSSTASHIRHMLSPLIQQISASITPLLQIPSSTTNWIYLAVRILLDWARGLRSINSTAVTAEVNPAVKQFTNILSPHKADSALDGGVIGVNDSVADAIEDMNNDDNDDDDDDDDGHHDSSLALKKDKIARDGDNDYNEEESDDHDGNSTMNSSLNDGEEQEEQQDSLQQQQPREQVVA